MKRPGVATMTSYARLQRLILGPVAHPAVDPPSEPQVPLARASVSSATCWASSRVGHSTSTCKPLSHPAVAPGQGIMKAPVLPVPVWAMPTTSFPSMAGGMAFPWMGVGSVQPNASTAANISSESDNSLNNSTFDKTNLQLISGLSAAGGLSAIQSMGFREAGPSGPARREGYTS